MALEALKRTLGIDRGDSQRPRIPVSQDQQFTQPNQGQVDQRIPSAREEAIKRMDNSPRRRQNQPGLDKNDPFGDAIGLKLSPEAQEFLAGGGVDAAVAKTREMTPLQLASEQSGQMQDFIDNFFDGAASKTAQGYAAQTHDMIMQMKGSMQDLRLDMAAMARLEQSGGSVATLMAPSGERLRITSQYIDTENRALSLTYMSREMGVLSLDMHRHTQLVTVDGQQQSQRQMTVRESLREAIGDDLAPAQTRSLTVAF